MFKKKNLILFALCAMLLSGCGVQANNKSFDILTLFSSKSEVKNRLWVGTFQLVFNDMKDEIIKHDIYFVNEKPTKDLIGLNNKEFNKDMLNESSYYKSAGKTSPKAKNEIKRAIKKKFNETSELIDHLDWKEGPGRFYAYAMLKKEFEFLNEFDKLEKSKFNNSKKEYEFFGIKKGSEEELFKNVGVFFYNGENDYAVELITKSGDKVYLYRTDKNQDFKSLFNKMKKDAQNYQGDPSFVAGDTIKVPNIKVKDKRNYKELCNKTIKGTDMYFSDAIETIEFELDSKGGKVKSEAIIMTRLNSIAAPIKKQIPRHFNFDKTFVIFLIDSGKDDPYLAMRIEDLEGIGK